MSRPTLFASIFALLIVSLSLTRAFVPISTRVTSSQHASRRFMATDDSSEDGDNELVARRIIVTGDVQGGYYRTCVLNEAGKFRSLLGTMSPPDDSDTAEIYVEGKKKMVDGFVRWCKRGKVGLNQVTTVKEVTEESPTGLYDGFYVKTH